MKTQMPTPPRSVIKSEGENDRNWLMVSTTEDLFVFNRHKYWVFRESADEPKSWAVMEDGNASILYKGLESKDAAAALCLKMSLEKMTTNRNTAIEKLKECQQSDDPESAHGEADDILCDLLASLGYEDVVLEYDMITKWYA